MVIGAKKRLVGLDIDAGEIRGVELSGTASAPKINTWGREPLPQGAVEDGMIQQPDQVAAALAQLWSKNGFKEKNVILGVSNKDVLVRFANFQKVPEDKLGGLIRHQAQDYLPLSLASVVLDYTVIGETTGESGAMYEVILVAARREMLDVFLNTLSGARLNPADIDVSSLVLLKIMPRVQREGAVVLVDVANGQSNILIIADRVPRLARRIPVRLQDAAARMEVPVEELFSLAGLSESAPEAYLEWIDELVSEIRASISYYQDQPNALEVEEILLSGKGARAPEVAGRIEEVLNTPVKKLQPFTGTTRFNQMGNGQELDYSIAFSLALRGLEG